MNNTFANSTLYTAQQMDKKYMNETLCTSQQSVSAEVAMTAERLAKRAQGLAELLNVKLQSVMTSDTLNRGELGSIKEEREYPPLFNNLRGSFNAVSFALDSIESALNRTEL